MGDDTAAAGFCALRSTLVSARCARLKDAHAAEHYRKRLLSKTFHDGMCAYLMARRLRDCIAGRRLRRETCAEEARVASVEKVYRQVQRSSHEIWKREGSATLESICKASRYRCEAGKSARQVELSGGDFVSLFGSGGRLPGSMPSTQGERSVQ